MIDLHTHTCCSDGADSVEALLRRAEEMKLSVLSITDHNTVAAYRGRGISEYSGTPSWVQRIFPPGGSGLRPGGNIL